MHAFFGRDTKLNILESSIRVDPSRSPFIKERIDVLYEAGSIEELISQVNELPQSDQTFKLIFVKNPSEINPTFIERQAMERGVGLAISRQVDLTNPEQLFAMMNVNQRWVFGELFLSKSIWFHHEKKPHNYSTALSTRLARSVVNIAVPDPRGIKVIDPCCGIGTVVIEASSMGIDIEGSDLNPLVMKGLRENLAHFGVDVKVTIKDMKTITGDYDVAIIDMPYNLCSVITEEEKVDMFKSARMFAKKIVVVTIESVDEALKKSGFKIVDRCIASKNKTFAREVLVCKRNEWLAKDV
nr:RsmD family RNA methyltransferase [Salipaludibacillus daqingensis]